MSKVLDKTEVKVIFAKGFLGAFPIIGPLMAEVAGAIIPDQRIERLEEFVEKFEKKINKTIKERIEEKIKKPEYVDFFEDAFIQASRALSDSRKDYIASLLKNSLTNEELEYIEYKRLFNLLSELNDLEILMLKSQLYMLSDGEEAKEFWDKHGKALEKPLVFDGASQEEIDKGALFKTHRTHLINIGLLKPRFNTYRKGEIPEFDNKTGMLKASGYNITSLGMLLLKNIDESEEIKG